MVMTPTLALLASIYEDLMRLRVTYNYMLINAPTEESRRLVDMNLMTVKHTMEELEHLYMAIVPDTMLPMHTPMDIPVFVDFMDAARFAFMTETHLIKKANDLHGIIEECYHHSVFHMIVAHQLNAMRLLYLDMF
jgi:hypothetical protein